MTSTLSQDEIPEPEVRWRWIHVSKDRPSGRSSPFFTNARGHPRIVRLRRCGSGPGPLPGWIPGGLVVQRDVVDRARTQVRGRPHRDHRLSPGLAGDDVRRGRIGRGLEDGQRRPDLDASVRPGPDHGGRRPGGLSVGSRDRLGRHGREPDGPKLFRRRRDLPDVRRRPDLGTEGARGHPSHRADRRRSQGPGPRVRRRDRQPIHVQRRARGLRDHGRRPDLDAQPLHRRADGGRRSGHGSRGQPHSLRGGVGAGSTGRRTAAVPGRG